MLGALHEGSGPDLTILNLLGSLSNLQTFGGGEAGEGLPKVTAHIAKPQKVPERKAQITREAEESNESPMQWLHICACSAIISQLLQDPQAGPMVLAPERIPWLGIRPSKDSNSFAAFLWCRGDLRFCMLALEE